MSLIEAVIVAAIVVAFVVFAVVLAWAEYQTRHLPEPARQPPETNQVIQSVKAKAA